MSCGVWCVVLCAVCCVVCVSRQEEVDELRVQVQESEGAGRGRGRGSYENLRFIAFPLLRLLLIIIN
jgi:hypothetical protein